MLLELESSPNPDKFKSLEKNYLQFSSSFLNRARGLNSSLRRDSIDWCETAELLTASRNANSLDLGLSSLLLLNISEFLRLLFEGFLSPFSLRAFSGTKPLNTARLATYIGDLYSERSSDFFRYSMLDSDFLSSLDLKLSDRKLKLLLSYIRDT